MYIPDTHVSCKWLLYSAISFQYVTCYFHWIVYIVFLCCACQVTVNEVEFCKTICGLQSCEYRKGEWRIELWTKMIVKLTPQAIFKVPFIRTHSPTLSLPLYHCSYSFIYTDLCHKSSMIIENWNGHFLIAYVCIAAHFIIAYYVTYFCSQTISKGLYCLHFIVVALM